MKTLKIFSTIIICCCLASASIAQKVKTETFKVAGECGMCKNKIEKAAKQAGATKALWSAETKILKVTYSVAAASISTIQQAIAGVGYDTPNFKSTDEAYNNLHACCKYERDTVNKACCENEACGKGDDCCGGMDCCKDKECCKKDGTVKMDCCKDGKCTKEGPSGKDCCKQL